MGFHMELEDGADVNDLRAALAEAAALLETAERDGHVTAGWLEDARTWANCWRDVIVNG